MSEDDQMLMARAPFTHPLGKLTTPVKTNVPECVGEKLVQTATSLGMTESELVREILCHWGFSDLMARLEQERRQVTTGNWPGNDQERS